MYLTGNNLPWLFLISGKLFSDKYFASYSLLLISSVFVVPSCVGCLWITSVKTVTVIVCFL